MMTKTIGFNWLRHKVNKPDFALSDPAAFYASLKGVTGKLTQTQVNTINGLLKACDDWPLPWMAYALATAWHEARFIPQREWGRGVGRRYGKPNARMRPNAALPTYGKQVPYGRGLVQLTWVENYEWADERLALGGALLRNFDLALEPEVSARILKLGLHEGAFNPRGKGIAYYIPKAGAKRTDYVAARTLVNLNDKADLIAGHALAFGAALYAGGWRDA